MKQDPRVAILVLNYNGRDCLPECLRALRALDYRYYDVVVIDNGSNDQSFSEAKKNFPENIYLAKETNTGFASGMNTGIRYAQGQGYDLVWLLNYDTEVHPDSLRIMVEVQKKNPEIRAMSPVIINPDNSIWFAGGVINFFRMRTEHQNKITSSLPYQTKFLTGCAPLFSARLLQNVGNFDERFFLYYEDADVSYRLRAAGEALYVIPTALVTHTEKSNDSPQKLYCLVYFGLLFFALHTPKYLRPYIILYVTIRRIVNKIRLQLGLSHASVVAKAYADYFQKFQAGDQLYLHKLQ